MVKETFRKIVLIFISLFLLVSSVLAEIQFHPLSQVTPIDTNLNMNEFNITNVNYLIYNTGIIAAGIRGIPTTDIQDFAVIGSKIADRAVSASKLSNPLAGPINVNGAINASYYYDFENSSYYLDLASTGYSLLVAGSVGIGTTSPVKKLDVVGDINATGYVYGLTGLCIGTDCKTSWSQVSGAGVGPWDNSTNQIFVREGYPLFVNISNALLVNGTSSSIQLKPTSVIPLPLNGTIYYDASLNKFRCYQNGVWTDCITSVTEPGAGFWTLTGSSLYPNQTTWNVGIGTNVPSEKLEVQGRVLVASSNPFELEPSDQILDVKGSINATGNLYVGGNNIYGSGGSLRIALGDTTNVYASLLSLSGNLKIGGNNIQDSAGTNRITLSSGFVEFNDNIRVGGNNIQNSTGTNRISFSPGYILFNDNIRVGGNNIQNSTGTNRISFLAGITEFNDDIKVSGNNVRDSGNNVRITLGEPVIIGANLRVGGNDIQDSTGAIRITLGNPVIIPSGTSLNVDANTLFVDAVNDRVGIGTNSPIKKLDVVGDINATGNLYVGGNNIYGSGGSLRIALGDTTNVYASLLNVSGNLRVMGNNIQSSDGINRITLGNPTNINASLNLLSGYNLQIAGTNVIDTNRNIINVNWVNATNFNASNLICLGGICKNTWPSSSLVGGSGAGGQVAFWTSSDTLSGDYSLTWDNANKRLGIGTNVPSEKLEVQGRVLVASSNPFELEPSDNTLDVKGSINATVVIFIPRNSAQPFACDATKAGAMFYNTTDNKFYGCNSTNWVIIGG
jgi:hypothetical protein